MSRLLSRAERIAEAKGQGVDRLLAVAKGPRFAMLVGELATQEEFFLLAWQLLQRWLLGEPLAAIWVIPRPRTRPLTV